MNYDVNDYEILSMVADNEEATEVLFRKYQPLIVGLAKIMDYLHFILEEYVPGFLHVLP